MVYSDHLTTTKVVANLWSLSVTTLLWLLNLMITFLVIVICNHFVVVAQLNDHISCVPFL